MNKKISLGNVKLSHLTIDDLRARYDKIIYADGCAEEFETLPVSLPWEK